jgi:hypothetical protein
MKNHLMVNEQINAKHSSIAAFLAPSAATRVSTRLRRRTYHSEGPLQSWHIDGFDKLKPFGFAISGCIDGFSRKIIWLECAHTNNDPKVIASYFTKGIMKEDMKTANHLRTDKGTENSILAAIQCELLGDTKHHSYGTSPSNQRIEQFWSFFRPSTTAYYINLFRDLVDYGLFTIGNETQTEILRFVFMEHIREVLTKTMNNWNSHYMRRNNTIHFAGGRPEVLHDQLPRCGHNVPEQHLQSYVQLYPYSSQKCENTDFEDYLEFCCLHMDLNTRIRTPMEGVYLYTKLIQILQV